MMASCEKNSNFVREFGQPDIAPDRFSNDLDQLLLQWEILVHYF